METISDIYFDNAASSRVSRAAALACEDACQRVPGNPSAGHRRGREAAELLLTARKRVAGLIGAACSDVYFTSGGTESNAIAILGALKRAGVRAVSSTAEHPSAAGCFKSLGAAGTDVVLLSPTEQGGFKAAELAAALNERTVLVSLMHVNNETGVVTDIPAFSRVIRQHAPNALFHVDAVQGLGKHAIDVSRFGADLISFSAHKIHGMKGAGALYARSGIAGRIKPLFFGGGQERGLRAGTENLPGICAFGAAAEEAACRIDEDYRTVSAVKERLLRIPDEIEGAVINGGGEVSPYIINISFVGVKSEILQNALDFRGIYVSAGAACNTNKKAPENAVHAYGLGTKRAESAIRISLSRYNTPEEAEVLCSALKEIVPTIKRK